MVGCLSDGSVIDVNEQVISAMLVYHAILVPSLHREPKSTSQHAGWWDIEIVGRVIKVC